MSANVRTFYAIHPDGTYSSRRSVAPLTHAVLVYTAKGWRASSWHVSHHGALCKAQGRQIAEVTHSAPMLSASTARTARHVDPDGFETSRKSRLLREGASPASLGLDDLPSAARCIRSRNPRHVALAEIALLDDLSAETWAELSPAARAYTLEVLRKGPLEARRLCETCV